MSQLPDLKDCLQFFVERLILLEDQSEEQDALIPGCHLAARRTLYCHHGIYAGEGKVIAHLRDFGITECSFEEFAAGDEVFVIDHGSDQIYTYPQALERARSMLGVGGYNLFSNNCEHFATWCLTGQKRSLQVEKLLSLGLSLTAIEGIRRHLVGKSPLPPAIAFSLVCLLLSNDRVQDGIADLCDSPAAFINSAFENLKEFPDSAKDWVGEACTNLGESADSAFQTVSTGLEDMCDKLKESLGSFFDPRIN